MQGTVLGAQLTGDGSTGDSVNRITVLEVNDPRWESFVTAQPEALLFHHPGWARALWDEYGRKPFALACEDGGGRLLGILPLMETQGLPFSLGEHVICRRLASLPRTPVAGPLATSPEVAKTLLMAAAERAREAGVTLQVKALSSEFESIDGLVRVPWKEAYVIALPAAGREMNFGNARRNHRVKWAVNKAMRLGVTVRWADCEDDLRAWFELYLETMRWHQSLPRPYRFFVALWRNLHSRGLIRLLLAEHHQVGKTTLLAGCIYLVSGRTFYCWLNGRRRDLLGLHPNDAIHWHAIHEACEGGFRFYDFGEVDEDQQGLVEFKSKWGAQPVCSSRYYYPAPRHLQTRPSASYRLAHRLIQFAWRRVPLPATVWIGDRVYRYL